MADNDLTVRISADTQSAASDIGSFEKRLADLEQAYVRSGGAAHNATGATNEHAAAHTASEKAVEAHTGALGEASKGLNAVADHSRTAAMAFEQLGLDADAGASKIAGLAEVLERAGEATPALLAIGAAIAAASAVFTFLKDAVDEAAASERELVTIGALLRNQGVADWQEQTRVVDEYATALAHASTFGKTEFLGGMQAMIAYGVSLNDALRSQKAAEDLAAATGRSLGDAENELAMAYDGRTMALKRLGLVTSDEVQNGIAYETILERIESRMGGTSTAALQTYSGELQNLGNLVGELREEFGTALLPVVESFVNELRDGASGAKPLADQFKAWVNTDLPGLKQGAKGFADGLVHLAQDALPAVEQGAEKGMDWLKKLGISMSDDGDAAHGFEKKIGETTQAFADFVRGAQQAAQEIQKVDDALNAANKSAQDSGKAVHDFFVDGYQAQSDYRNDQLEKQRASFEAIANWAGRARDAITGAGEALATEADPTFSLKSGGPTSAPTIAPSGGSLEDAIAQAARTNANDQIDPAKLEQLLRVIGLQESGLGTTLDANGRGDNGHGYGPFQLDDQRGRGMTGPGRPQELLDSVVANPYKAASVAAQMFADDVKAAHGNIVEALSMYNSGGLTTAGLKYAHEVLGRLPQGSALAAMDPTRTSASAAPTTSKAGAKAPPTHPSDHQIPGTQKPKADSTVSVELIGAYEQENSAVTELRTSQAALELQLNANDVTEKQYAESVKTATTVEAERAAQAKYDAQVTEDLIAKRNLLLKATNDEKAANAGLTAGIEKLVNDRNRDAAEHDALAQKKIKLGELSATEESHMDNLATKVQATDKEIARLNQTIATNTSNLQHNQTALAGVVAKLDEFKNRAAETFAAASKSWEEHQQKTLTSLREDLDTANMTNAQKTIYYAATLSKMETLDAQYRAQKAAADAALDAAEKAATAKNATDADKKRYADALVAYSAMATAYAQNVNAMEQADSQYVESYKGALHDREETEKAVVDRIRGYETTFLDDLITKHHSLRDSLKDVWTGILSDFVQMIEKMIVESTLVKGVGASILGALGFSSASVGASATAMSLPAASLTASNPFLALSGAMLGAPGGGSGPTGTSSNPLYTVVANSGSAFNYAMTGSQTGVPGLSGGSGGGVFSILGGGGGGLGALALGGAASIAIGGSIGSALGMKPGAGSGAVDALGAVAAAGLIQGSMVGGGMMGGLGSFAAAGPWGIAALGAIALGGAFAGGMFGPHETAAEQPDIHDTSWAQDDTNWNGASGSFNGSTVTPESQYNTNNGGTSLGSDIAAWVKANQNDLSSLTPDQQALYAQYLQIMGGNPNADSSSYGIASEHQGNVTFGDGFTESVTQFESAVSSFATTVGATTSSSVWQLQRSYPNLAIGTLSPNGTYTATSDTPTNGTGSGSSTSTTPVTGTGGSGTVTTGGGQTVVNFNVSDKTVATVIVPAVGTGLARQQQGLRPGANRSTPRLSA